MKAKIVFGLLLIIAATLVHAQSVPVFIKEAELEGTEIWPFDLNKLDIERGQKVELRLELFAYANARNVEIRAYVSGYEYSSSNDVYVRAGPYDFDENTTYVRRLTFTLPEDVDLDDYKLRVVIADRNSFSQEYNYDLQINAPRHAMKITDVTFNPGSTVKAGQSLLGRVRLENKGQRDQKDVRVTMSIPGLDLSATQYIEEVENGDEQEETEEFFLRIPRCAEPGVYDVRVEASYNKNHDKVSGTGKITVLENEDCREPEPVVVVQQNVTQPMTQEQPKASSLRTALEVILLVLVALLVVVGLIIGFTRMKEE